MRPTNPTQKNLNTSSTQDTKESGSSSGKSVKKEKANGNVLKVKFAKHFESASRLITQISPRGTRAAKAEKNAASADAQEHPDKAGKPQSATTTTTSTGQLGTTTTTTTATTTHTNTTTTLASYMAPPADASKVLKALVDALQQPTPAGLDPVAVRGAFLSQQIPGMDHAELDALNHHLDQLSADDLEDPAIAHLTVSVKATLLDRHVRSNPMLSDALDPNTSLTVSNLSAPDLAALVGLQQDAQNLSRPMNFSQIYLSQTDDEPTGLIPGTKDFSFERLNHIEATGKAAKEQLLDREYAGDSAAKQALQNMSVRDDE